MIPSSVGDGGVFTTMSTSWRYLGASPTRVIGAMAPSWKKRLSPTASAAGGGLADTARRNGAGGARSTSANGQAARTNESVMRLRLIDQLLPEGEWGFATDPVAARPEAMRPDDPSPRARP